MLLIVHKIMKVEGYFTGYNHLIYICLHILFCHEYSGNTFNIAEILLI